MKKNVEWAKNRIKNTLKFEALNDREVGFKTAMQEALEIIDQLDEPEVLSQEWIDENITESDIKGNGYVAADALYGILVPKQEEITEEQAWEVIHGKYGDETLQNNIDYVESQGYVVIEKPTIPPEVDELIRRGKGRGETLTNTVGLMKNAGWNRSPYADGAEWAVNNLSDFVIAWEHGYEVEEEQKYYAKAKGWEVFEKNSHHPYWDVLKPFGKDERLTISTFGSRESLTKEEWNNLGLNENNADFVNVEELEE